MLLLLLPLLLLPLLLLSASVCVMAWEGVWRRVMGEAMSRLTREYRVRGDRGREGTEGRRASAPVNWNWYSALRSWSRPFSSFPLPPCRRHWGV